MIWYPVTNKYWLTIENWTGCGSAREWGHAGRVPERPAGAKTKFPSHESPLSHSLSPFYPDDLRLSALHQCPPNNNRKKCRLLSRSRCHYWLPQHHPILASTTPFTSFFPPLGPTLSIVPVEGILSHLFLPLFCYESPGHLIQAHSSTASTVLRLLHIRRSWFVALVWNTRMGAFDKLRGNQVSSGCTCNTPNNFEDPKLTVKQFGESIQVPLTGEYSRL